MYRLKEWMIDNINKEQEFYEKFFRVEYIPFVSNGTTLSNDELLIYCSIKDGNIIFMCNRKISNRVKEDKRKEKYGGKNLQIGKTTGK